MPYYKKAKRINSGVAATERNKRNRLLPVDAYNTQQKSEVILVSIDELFCDVECGIFFVEFHCLMQNPG